MTTPFENRLAKAARLQVPFIKAFNEVCTSHTIAQFGIESTELQGQHERIRGATDPTSHFLRFLPDSALFTVSAGSATGTPSSMVEFKVHDTLVMYDSLLARIQQEHFTRNAGNPPLRHKQDVFAIEEASLDAYQKLAAIGTRVIVIGWQTKRTIDQDVIRARYAQDIVTCQVLKPQPELRVSGSGTPIANVHFGDFIPVQKFFAQEFQIPESVVDDVVLAVLNSEETT